MSQPRARTSHLKSNVTPPAAGSPRLADPSSQALWFEAWNLTVSSQELVKLEPGACQVEAWTLASSSLELQFRAWMLSTGGLGFAKFQAGTCQVGALGLSGGGSEVVKFEPGSWQVEALNLTTLGCSWFAPLSLRRALPWPALSASEFMSPRFPRARARFPWSMRVVKGACCRVSGVDVCLPRAGARFCSGTIAFLEPGHF